MHQLLFMRAFTFLSFGLPSRYSRPFYFQHLCERKQEVEMTRAKNVLQYLARDERLGRFGFFFSSQATARIQGRREEHPRGHSTPAQYTLARTELWCLLHLLSAPCIGEAQAQGEGGGGAARLVGVDVALITVQVEIVRAIDCASKCYQSHLSTFFFFFCLSLAKIQQ